MIEKDTISIIALADLLKSKGIITEDELAEYIYKWRFQAESMTKAVYFGGMDELVDEEKKDLYLSELLIWINIHKYCIKGELLWKILKK